MLEALRIEWRNSALRNRSINSLLVSVLLYFLTIPRKRKKNDQIYVKNNIELSVFEADFHIELANYAPVYKVFFKYYVRIHRKIQ